ncbi:hypothetical protein FQ179_05425 [Pusillimonas sp. ANT_WB101]|nr:hypothetical protein FQ179_05425 [Pusillimonas sp. ANT_WB101]
MNRAQVCNDRIWRPRRLRPYRSRHPGRGPLHDEKLQKDGTLVATNKGDRWFFVFGFAKNARANISDSELEALQSLASDLLQLTQIQLK